MNNIYIQKAKEFLLENGYENIWFYPDEFFLKKEILIKLDYSHISVDIFSYADYNIQRIATCRLDELFQYRLFTYTVEKYNEEKV